jgi:hypothetical protein
MSSRVDVTGTSTFTVHRMQPFGLSNRSRLRLEKCIHGKKEKQVLILSCYDRRMLDEVMRRKAEWSVRGLIEAGEKSIACGEVGVRCSTTFRCKWDSASGRRGLWI